MIRIVTNTEEEFWKKLGSFIASRSIFEEQGEEHGDIDFRLVEKIDDYLSPKIGTWEQSDHWFHNIDFYGDGVRSLEFSADSFSPDFLRRFQAMLIGEHSEFTVLCKVMTNFSDSGTKIGSIAIRNDRMLVSYPLAAYFYGQI